MLSAPHEPSLEFSARMAQYVFIITTPLASNGLVGVLVAGWLCGMSRRGSNRPRMLKSRALPLGSPACRIPPGTPVNASAGTLSGAGGSREYSLRPLKKPVKSWGCVPRRQHDPHETVALGCTDCHGGNANCQTKEQAHINPIYDNAWISAQRIPCVLYPVE